MENYAYPYPASPQNVDNSITEPSRAFKKEVAAVLGSIGIFIGTYVLLVAVAIALVGLCAFAGFWIITTIKNLWVVLFGVGLIGLGLMVLFFLFKFVFKTIRVDRSRMVEVTKKDQPALFDFIAKLAKETQTPLPKKVYLSADVNAAVFYDSSFWSMFFPVRKNLNIGLGLVNCLNISELKSVIAHEFGHFSQKSMKLGSYVYNVDQILHNLLYDNDDYAQTLQSWANISNVFAFFATLTTAIVKGIQEILLLLYRRINKRYLALSRQMEFHADAVAASVAGSASLVTALRKLDIAHSCYETVLRYYEAWLPENRKGLNAYEHHATVLRHFAEKHSIPLNDHHIMTVSPELLSKNDYRRVIVRDQWASHPDVSERENELRRLAVVADTVEDAAWIVFRDAEQIQRQLTDSLYSRTTFSQPPALMDGDAFRSLYSAEIEKYGYHKAYKGFYDGRDITVFDPDLVALDKTPACEMTDVLTEKVLSLPFQIEALNADIRSLESIQLESSEIRTFDFEGRKCMRQESPALIVKLKEQLNNANALLEEADKELFRLSLKKSALLGNQNDVAERYRKMFASLKSADAQIKHVESMLAEAAQLYQANCSHDKWTAITNNMTREGAQIKVVITKMLDDEAFSPFYSEEAANKLRMFLVDNRKYFFNVGCDSEAINLYMEAINIYRTIILKRAFLQKKSVLDMQIKLICGSTEFAERC